MSAQFKNHIGGQWVDGTSINENINPSNTTDVVGHYARASRAQADEAIATAKDV